MLIPGDATLKAGQTYSVTVQFPSQRTDVDLRMLVSALSWQAHEKVENTSPTATRVVFLSTVVNDNAGGPGVHEAVLRYRVLEEHLGLRASTVEDLVKAGFQQGKLPDYPRVVVWRVWTTGDTTAGKFLGFAVGGVVAFGLLWLLSGGKTRRPTGGMAYVAEPPPKDIHPPPYTYRCPCGVSVVRLPGLSWECTHCGRYEDVSGKLYQRRGARLIRKSAGAMARSGADNDDMLDYGHGRLPPGKARG